MEKFKLIIFLFLFFNGSLIQSTKLNYPRVLLPIFDKIKVNFTLEVIEKIGCYKWASSRQDLIQIKPIFDDDTECSSKAIVTVMTKDKHRNTAIVLAEDVSGAGEVLRCDVILDLIHELEVMTTTHELYLEEAPETFQIFALDDQGNSFTTLEGVEFNWDIKQTGNALRFLTFTESKYHEVPKELGRFEAEGIKGYMGLLEGIDTGTAKVSVRLNYPEYDHVQPIKVLVTVLANIILDPTDVHIMVDDTINFRVLQLKQGKLHEIKLNSQYYLEIVDHNLASIKGRSVTGKKLGKTSVILRDRNVADRFNSNDNDPAKSAVPTATLTISTPYKITINLLPYFNWMTVEGEKHEIAIDLYTIDDQKILLGSKYKMKSIFDESIFAPIQETSNGSRIYGEALQEGRSSVQGKFEKLAAKAELQVYKELILEPKRVILPYDPNAPKTQKIQFQAKGGDGAYLWTSYNLNLMQINQNGLANVNIIDSDNRANYHLDESTKSVLTKHTHIKVALTRNTKMYRTSEIFFLPPIKLEIIKYNFETALKDYVKLHIGLFAFVNNTFIPFTQCDNLNFELEFANQIFQHEQNYFDMDPLANEACHIIYLKATAVGSTQLKIQYRFMDKILKQEISLVVFQKLLILNPLENEVVLPIGASRNIIYLNGPQKIFNIDSELIKNIEYDMKIAEVTHILEDRMHAFKVLCLKVGEVDFKLILYNFLTTNNFEPYISEFTTRINCVKPRFINLYSTEKLRESCPLEIKNPTMHLKDRSSENLEIEIEILDHKNRKLMNISSLVIDWEFGQGDKLHKIDYIVNYENEFIEGIEIPGKNYFSTAWSEMKNNFKIKAKVNSYNSKLLRNYGINPESPSFGVYKQSTKKYVKPIIENEINFIAVNNTLFSFRSVSVYLARDHTESIQVSQGSGYYLIELSETDIISIDYDKNRKELIITPHKVGHVIVELTDRCLMTEPARLSVSVVTIRSVELEVSRHVEKTKTIEAIVKLYDSNNELLNINYKNLDIYNLQYSILNPTLISIKLGEQSNLNSGEIRYLITGNELGETNLIFSSVYDENMATSDPISIQVFPPLKLYPRNSTLVIGSSVQIYYHGGPQPDVNIIYSIRDDSIASMDSSIVIAQKLGTTKITGKCIGINPITGKQIIFSEDSIEINVVPLKSIQIRTPLVRIRTGAIMPVFLWGVPELSPMILGTLENVKILWSTNQPDVIEIFSIFSEAGIEYSEHDLISVRVKALNPGKAKIEANFILNDGQIFNAHIEIVVFKILELESPKPIKIDSILIAPRSTIQLKANLDDVTYKLVKDGRNIIKCSSDGILKSGDTLGRDSVIAKTVEQTLPIDIEVKNVQYILTKLELPFPKFKYTEEKIPRGMNLILKISLHDNLGNEFSHSNIDDVNGIRYDLSHKDMVDIQIGNNFTIVINLPRETNNMIGISLKDSAGIKYSEDYIKLSVADSQNIFPTKAIFSVGDIICLESPLASTSHWLSSDENLVTVDKYTGISQVIGNRNILDEKIIITNGDKNNNYIKYDLEIREADKIEFLKSHDILSDTNYHGHLLISNHHIQGNKLSNLIAKNISKCSSLVEIFPTVKFFKCFISSKQQLGQDILKNYKVTPYFNKDQGLYSCYIELITTISDVFNIIKINDVHIELEAQLPNGISDTATLKLVPGIKVTPDKISVDQINLQGIMITGLDKVLQKIEVKSSDKSVLEIILQQKVHGSLQYKLKLLDELASDEQLFVHIYSPLTLQDIKVPIEATKELMEKCSHQPFFKSPAVLINFVSNLGLIFSTLICASIVIYFAVFGFGDRNRVQVNNDAFSPIRPTTQRIDSSSTDPNQLSSSFGSPNNSGSSNISRGNESSVYGNTSLLSPQTRNYRRII